MPTGHTANVQTAHGPVAFNYFIATPKGSTIDTLDPTVPTLLCIHPLFTAVGTFHYQFADPGLRRCNLVTLDLLLHGHTVGTLPKTYLQKEAADDVAAFIDALKLPKCIIVAISTGAIIGLQLAISYPGKVSALFLASPLESQEPEDVLEGRKQIVKAWRESFVDGALDPEGLYHVSIGAIDLVYSGKMTPLTQALYALTVPNALVNWGPERMDEFEAISVTFFANRKLHTQEELATLRNMPIALLHAEDDLVYSPAYMEGFVRELGRAGVDAQIHDLPGAPHYAPITHPHLVNPILNDFVEANWAGPALPPFKPGTPLTSPFEPRLREVGWKPDHELDSDDDE